MDRRTFLKLGLTGIAVALAPKAWALKYYPNPSGKKWAVLYATWCGSSRDAAIWISEGMGGIADVFDVRENPDLKGFDHVIIGSSIRGFDINPLIKKYIENNKSVLKGKVRGHWAVCGNMQQPPGPQQKDQYIDKNLAKLTGADGVPARVFLGRVTKDLLEKEAKDLLEGFGPIVDYDNLKRNECLAFGKEVLASVK